MFSDLDAEVAVLGRMFGHALARTASVKGIHGLFRPDRRKPAIPLNSALAFHCPRFNDLRRSASLQTTPQC